MNKIFRIVWSDVSQAWVAVSELTKSHKKRASATAVAVALVAGMLSPFAEASKTASGAGVDSDNPAGGYTPPRPTDIEGPDGSSSLNGLGFGLVVVDKEGHRKEILPGKKIENTTDDDEKISTVITVEPNNDSAPEPPKNETSYLYLVEGEGVTIDQNGRSAKFSVNTGDGLKIDDNNKVAADTVELTVENGKVTTPEEDNKKKLVNAGNLSTALNDLGWKVSANGSGSTASIVKSGEEVEFKGEGGVTVTATTDKNGKHVVTIKTEQPQGGSAAGGSTPVTAGDGISVSTDNKVSVKAKTDGGLTVGADGVSVKAKDKGGLAVDTDGVSVKTDGTTISVDAATGNVKAVTGGFTTNATGDTVANGNDGDKLTTVTNVANAINAAKVKVEAGNGAEVAHDAATNTYTVSAKVADNKGLESTAQGLSIKSKTNGGITVDADGVSVNAKTDGGLTVGADGVSVKAKDKGGLAVDTDGVSVKTDGTTISVDAATGNVKAVTGTITAGATPSVDTADENKLATAGNVASAINAAKTKVVAGSGMKVTSSGNEYTVSADLPFTKNADKSISLNEEGVIRNVANGRVAKDSKDAVNGSQLHAVEHRLSGNMDKLNHRIDKVGKRADAGTASAIATANLLQSYRPGLSAATAAVGQYRGQSAIAVGYSRLSDNGKYGVKFSLGANTQGNVGAGAGVAYFW